MKIDLLQMDVQFGRIQANIDNALAMLDSLVPSCGVDGGHLIVLPEMWSCGYDLDNIAVYAQETPHILRIMQKYAQSLQAFIVPGSLPTFQSNANDMMEASLYNTTYLISPHGEVVNQYSKAHLFRLMQEDKYFTAGNNLSVYPINNEHSLAQFVCYDLRFPEAFRKVTYQGATIFTIVAQWPKPRMYHWRSLLIARAIENQAYIVGVNNCGTDRVGDFFGHSMVVDPWGEVILETDENPGVHSCVISERLVHEIRQKLPFLGDRRVDLY